MMATRLALSLYVILTATLNVDKSSGSSSDTCEVVSTERVSCGPTIFNIKAISAICERVLKCCYDETTPECFKPQVLKTEEDLTTVYNGGTGQSATSTEISSKHVTTFSNESARSQNFEEKTTFINNEMTQTATTSLVHTPELITFADGITQSTLPSEQNMEEDTAFLVEITQPSPYVTTFQSTALSSPIAKQTTTLASVATLHPTSLNPTTEDATTYIDETNQHPTSLNPTTEDATTFADGTTQHPTSLNPTTEDATTYIDETTQHPTSLNPTVEAPTTFPDETPTTFIDETTQHPTSLNPTTEAPTTFIDGTTLHPTNFIPITKDATIFADGTTRHPTSLNPSTEAPTAFIDETTLHPTAFIPTTEDATTFADGTTRHSTSVNPTTEKPTQHPTSVNPITDEATTFADETTQLATSLNPTTNKISQRPTPDTGDTTTFTDESTLHSTSLNPTAEAPTTLTDETFLHSTSLNPTTKAATTSTDETTQHRTSSNPSTDEAQHSVFLNPTTEGGVSLASTNTPTIPDADACSGPTNCSAFATCINLDTGYTCRCWDGYKDLNNVDPGTFCAKVNRFVFTYDSKLCSNYSECALDAMEVFRKYCEDSEDPLCTNYSIRDFDECAYPNGETEHNNCSINAKCENNDGSYTCTCKDGYDDLDPVIPGRNCSRKEI